MRRICFDNKKVYFRLLIIGLALRSMFRLSLGDEIIYKNKKYSITNGNRLHQWTLDSSIHALKSKCKKVYSIKGMIFSFKRAYSFYMNSWYSIWIHRGIKKWMGRLPIWNL